MKKRILIAFLCLIIFGTTFGLPQPSCADETTGGILLTCPSAILMEASTKSVIYEKAPDERRSPASITKIMTAILIFDAIEAGKISLEDEVVTSAYAKSMGGSQVYLEEGEKQTVDTLIKCIMVSSGNDASVAMAEYIAGSESSFVQMMNERAASLGMENTHFEDCCGLTDSDNHYTTARDIALMAQELITRYPQIKSYTTIWMENITHVTMQGSKEFGLANTNKLLKTNQYVKGLKTGSTSKAKYCVSTVAEKDGVQLIAVVMAAPDYKIRFKESEKLINYGFSNCKVYTDNDGYKTKIKVTNGKKDKVDISTNRFSYVDTKGRDLSKVTKKVFVNKKVKAPVKKNQKVGYIEYYLNDKSIGKSDIVSVTNVEKADYFHTIKSFALRLLQLQYS